MAAPIVAAQSFWEHYGNAITAGIALLAAAILLYVVHRAMRRSGDRLAAAIAPDRISAEADTRLRFLRRVVEAAIILVGVALALAQLTSLDRLAATLLASGAIAAAVLGFASRQVLANAIAGIVLAVTQPLRIGDLVTFEDQTGTVEDVSLTYTWLRTGADARLIIPNERLAAGVLRNDSIRTSTVALEVSAWLELGADEEVALAALQGLADARAARIAEVTSGGMRIEVAGPPVPPSERIVREGELRAAVLRALREAGARGRRDEP
jgi:small conductance mechanosensitive channel